MVQHGGALRAVRRNQIIAARRCSHSLHSADGDHIGIIAGRGDRPVAVIVVGIVSAIVTSGDHHYDASFPGLFHSLAQGIESIALENAAAQRKINDPDVVLALQRDSLLNGCYNGAVGSRTILVESPQVDDVGVRRDTPEGYVAISAGGTSSVASDDAGNMRAVAIQVACSIGGRIEILTVDNSANLAGTGLRQVPNGVYSAIDNGNAHSRAVISQAVGNIGSHGGHCIVHRSL